MKTDSVKVMWSLFICSCTIECTCGSWGRFLSGVVATKLHSWTIVKCGQVIMGIFPIYLLVFFVLMMITMWRAGIVFEMKKR